MTVESYEPSDVQPLSVVRVAVLFFAGIAASLGLVVGLFALFAAGSGPPVEARHPAPRGVRLETIEGSGRSAIEAAAEAKLHSHYWPDRQAKRGLIPIEEAMQRLARQGWPDPEKPR